MTGDPTAVPLSAVPTPMATVTIADRRPTLSRTNEAFVDAFGPVETGTPVGEWWRSAPVESDAVDAADLRAALTGGEDVDGQVRVPGDGQTRTYRLRAVADEETRALSAAPDRGGVVDADRIATVVSHDLRNPLDVAKAHLRAARETGETEHFDRLGAAHDRMERIIQDVLTLSRGESTVAPVPDVDVAEVAADAWATVDTREGTVTVDPGLPTVEADPDRLRRLFENLFRNSVEHGDTHGTDGGVAVRVAATDDGFLVADDGPGIAAADRDRVFEPGYTADESGTGLGLTIVERIAHAHGWTVSAGASDAGGAAFRFDLGGV
jgi:signal transduction histidine kinase